MKIQAAVPVALLLLLVLASGCAQKAPLLTSNTAIAACVQACEVGRANGKDLSAGPCLLNPVPQNEDWVCDVAHNPRLDIDSNPRNQCSAYAYKSARYFIEVTPDCQLIGTG